MFKITESNDSNVITLEASGKVTSEDYIATLRPFLDVVTATEKKLRLLFSTTPDFQGYTAGAFFEDLKLGIHHFNSFEKCAVVSDVAWIVNSCKFFSPIIPCQIKTFPSKDFAQAKAWLEGNQN